MRQSFYGLKKYFRNGEDQDKLNALVALIIQKMTFS